MNLDEKTYFKLKDNIERFSPESLELIKDLMSNDSRTLSVIIQLLSTLRKPISLLELEVLINFLLQNEGLINDVFRVAFAKENLDLENIILLNKILHSEVYGRILRLNDKSEVFEAIKNAFALSKDDERRFLIIDEDNHSMVELINHFSKTFTPLIGNKIYIINASSQQDYFDGLKGADTQITKRDQHALWLKSFVCRDGLYAVSMGLLYNEYESFRISSSDEKSDRPLNYYVDHTTALLRNFYYTFSKLKQIDALDEIAIFCLLYFNLNAEGYSSTYLTAANDDINDVMIEFLMSNPADHLDLIINEDKKLRYQHVWKYTIPYKGEELSGSSFSQFGNVFTLHDSPIVERILSPFFERLYKENCEKPNHENSFIELIENRVFRSLETSARNPIYLKRAAIRSLLLGLLSEIPEKKAIYKKLLTSVLRKTGGLPECSAVVFSSLMSLSAYINKFPENSDNVFELIIEDSKLYGSELPTNVFAIQTILFLIKNKYLKAERFLDKLLENPDYIKRDDWDYHTISNLGNYADYESSFVFRVIKAFVNSKDWLLTGKGWNVNEVVPYLVEMYLKKGHEAQEVHDEIRALAHASIKAEAVDNLCTYFLRNLGERDPENAYSIIKEIIGERNPWEIFLHGRDSLVSVADHMIEKAAKAEGEEEKKALLDRSIELIELFIADPEPSTEEGGHGYSYHTKIINNEDTSIITTVRGHVCWAVQKLCVHNYSLEKAWKYTDKLLRDKNLYVVYQALVPFIEVVKRRSNLSSEAQAALDETIEYCLDEYSQYKPLASHLAHVCSYYRDIDEAMAEKFIGTFAKTDNFGFFIVYFAYFREDQYPEKDVFNSGRFKEQIIRLVREQKEPELIKQIFTQIDRVIDENSDFLPRVIELLYAYEHNPATDKTILHCIYRIVSQVLETDKNKTHYDTILSIYKKFIKIEQDYIESLFKIEQASPFLIDYTHKKVLSDLYEISKEDYYTCISEIVDFVADKRLHIDHFSLAETLAGERNPAFIPRAIEVLQKLAIFNLKYYEIKSQLEALL